MTTHATAYTYDHLETIVIWLAKMCAGHSEHYRLSQLFIAAFSKARIELELEKSRKVA